MKALFLLLLLGSAASAENNFRPATPSDSGYVAHEWGTFTSVQGGDGALLGWRPLRTADLPGFVYDWTKPGMSRRSVAILLGKGGLVSLQRMETPVIYFYNDSNPDLFVDVTVRFPLGLITEWYPQAAQIGPSAAALLPGTPAAAASAVSAAAESIASDSRILWRNVRIVPRESKEAVILNAQLAAPDSFDHYFAARETASSPIVLDGGAGGAESEKFLFYRGTGSFATPLQVTMISDDELTVANTGGERMAHLFLLRVREGRGTFFALNPLEPGGSLKTVVTAGEREMPLPELSRRIGQRMREALQSEGLFAPEAAAMIDTWEPSWFAEEGLRLLYVLPRRWTEETLPIAFDPPPRDLVRVMVGRAEIISPSTEQHLRDQLARASQGEDAAREHVAATLGNLGRFAEPALVLALRNADEKTVRMGWDLFQTMAQPAPLNAAGASAAGRAVAAAGTAE